MLKTQFEQFAKYTPDEVVVSFFCTSVARLLAKLGILSDTNSIFFAQFSKLVVGFSNKLLPTIWFCFRSPKIFAAIFFLFSTELSTYPSATVVDFHPPWRFRVEMSAPESANKDADDLRRQCPVYRCGLSSFRYEAIFFDNEANVFLPTG